MTPDLNLHKHMAASTSAQEEKQTPQGNPSTCRVTGEIFVEFIISISVLQVRVNRYNR